MIKFDIVETKEYNILKFELDGPIEPEFLGNLEPPKVDTTKGIIISGRGPIWLYCYLTHYYHITPFVATFDPRLGGAVVVESHTSKVKPGDVIKLDNCYAPS
jgi:CRISPR-associated protein Csx3